MDIEKLEKIIETKLSSKRYYHSICVMERCAQLAEKFHVDIKTAKKVGIVHDIAKEMSDSEKLQYVKDNDIKIDEVEKENIGLLHAKIGANIAQKNFGFSKEMVDAIKEHTTGSTNMTLLSKILFIADRTSKDRNFPDIEVLNNLLEENIDEAVLYILNKKIQLQIEKRQSMHPDSIIARNSILKVLK